MSGGIVKNINTVYLVIYIELPNCYQLKHINIPLCSDVSSTVLSTFLSFVSDRTRPVLKLIKETMRYTNFEFIARLLSFSLVYREWHLHAACELWCVASDQSGKHN